jgi:hypothetical protein
MTDNTKGRLVIQRAQRERAGFLSEDDVAKIAADPTTRLTPLLVRCGGGRFTCPAQDVKHFIAIIERTDMDCVRDVSIPAGTLVYGRAER